MTKLRCEYLSIRYIWLYVIIISRTSFRVNPHSIVCLDIKKFIATSKRYIWRLSDSNKIRIHNYVVCKHTVNHLAKLEKS